MKDQDGGLKVPLFDLYQCHVQMDAKISLVPKHQLIVPSTLLALATNIPTYKATKIHKLTPLTYELFFQNSSIMAESAELTMDKALEKAPERLNVSREKEKIILKREQETAVKELLAGRDVMAILPTGFGKSLTFTVFAIAKEQLRSETTCVIVVSPLKRAKLMTKLPKWRL